VVVDPIPDRRNPAVLHRRFPVTDVVELHNVGAIFTRWKVDE
jgi:hypothetical protein